MATKKTIKESANAADNKQQVINVPTSCDAELSLTTAKIEITTAEGSFKGQDEIALQIDYRGKRVHTFLNIEQAEKMKEEIDKLILEIKAPF